MTQNYIERYWRDATPEDAIKEPPMVARFKHEESGKWKIELLLGFDRDGSVTTWSGQSRRVKFCQVYDAPDPGEGWRLIDVDSETPQHGDEYFAQSSKVWCCCNDVTQIAGYSKDSIIRRRITPTVTYVPFTWEDREQLRGKRLLTREPHRQVEFTCDEFQLNDDGSFFVGEFYSVWLCKNAVFTDTGKPVSKEVVQ